ncbi:MAG: glycosyltransferase family 2 protein [Solirubrobacteraceae bacterium]
MAAKDGGRSIRLVHTEQLTACLIVQDEQERLPRALDSVGFCDEIVVVDGGSTDGTVEIARAAGARVIVNPWPGFAAQRNVALDAASGEWVLEIDADERVSPPLRASIEELLAAPDPDVKIAVCALRNRFLGRLLGPSAKYPAYRSRLFRRGAYRHDESRAVHEGIEPRQRPAVLAGDLEHELAATSREALLDAWRYARLESSHIVPPSSPLTYLVGVVIRPAAKVAYRTIVDRGWRDGWPGLAKILLDAASDVLVWMLVLVNVTGSTTPNEASKQSTDRHFGHRPAGSPKVVAIAARGDAAQRARRWLGSLRAEGLDVALVSDDSIRDEEIPLQAVSRLRPLATMRALDVETQIRTVHAVVAFGHRATLVRRLLPSSLRPKIPGLDAHTDPVLAAKRLRAGPQD